MSPSTHYDVILIGGGHNGLVAATYLAKAGRKVLVLEARSQLGGLAGVEEIFPGFHAPVGHADTGLLAPQVIKDLRLESHSLAFHDVPAAVFAPQPDGRALTLWRDPVRAQAEIARFSQKDAARYPDYLRVMARLAAVLAATAAEIPPDIITPSLKDLFPWARVALKARRLGRKDMMDFLRLLPMTAQEWLDEWFESPAVQATFGAPSVTGGMLGPQSSGSAYMLLYQQMGAPNAGYRSARFVQGGVGAVMAALARAAESHGVEILTDTPVARILIEDGRAAGVMLQDRDVLRAPVIVSNLDPRRTLFGLVGPQALNPRVMRRVRAIRFKGSTARLTLALSGLPRFKGAPDGHDHLAGYTLICPSLEYLERAYDDAKYGRISAHPAMELHFPTLHDADLAPAGQHLMSVTIRFTPYQLEGASWAKEGKRLTDLVIKTLDSHAPGFKSLVRHTHLRTPASLETDFAATEGGIMHGQMALDQWLMIRPVAGYAQYATQIPNLYLCGAGTHPGGGLTGLPGRNAARAILSHRG
ncbi:MAG: NAD(P)/FAD-dependent oxidoreductase [Chloroflexi bacterium]|nr:NAD(P)/FAD-dependent oxidoreductase [Chloroflexota bacterium]